jgi:hypothetical protein
VLDLVFFKTPIIEIVSPWKRVDVKWNIDEDGDLIPAKDLEGIPDGNILFPSYNVSEFWKANGQISLSSYSKDFTSKYQKLNSLNQVQLGIAEPVFRPYILRSYPEPGNNNTNPPTYGEDDINLPNNYVSIRKPKYLKISDEYIDRSFKMKMVLHGANPFTTFTSLDEGEHSEMFKYDFLSGNNLILTSKSNTTQLLCERLKCKVQEANSTFSTELNIGDWFTVTSKRVDAVLDEEGILLPANGFFNVKLHAPLSPDYTAPLFKGYTIAEMSIKYTEQKTWSDSLERTVDFTTVKAVDIFHGDSIQDLSEKQFRFRRPIYSTTGGYGTVAILSYQNLFPLQPWFYHYFISYASYMAIAQNPELFNVVFGGENILMNDLATGVEEAWSITATFGGAFFIQINSQLITHPSGIGTNITDFLNLFVGESEVFISGYEPEDNEWRESWKRHGQTEDIRFGVALGRIYHDVQPEALVKIEGTAIGCVFPREIGRFLWRDIKNFIPTRITIDFTKGRTTALFLESLHQNVTDYVD